MDTAQSAQDVCDIRMLRAEGPFEQTQSSATQRRGARILALFGTTLSTIVQLACSLHWITFAGSLFGGRFHRWAIASTVVACFSTQDRARRRFSGSRAAKLSSRMII